MTFGGLIPAVPLPNAVCGAAADGWTHVRTRDLGHERRAIEIMKRQSGRDVHVHAISAGA
jgi:hypothetical protein